MSESRPTHQRAIFGPWEGEPIKRNENGESRHATSRTGPAAGDGYASEFGAVTIDFKPAPDAEERLRRLFTILARVVEDAQPKPGQDPLPDDDGEGES